MTCNAADRPADCKPKLRLRAVPLDFATACDLVARLHRHHLPPVGHKFSIGAMLGETLVGAVIVGRPVSRMRDDGFTLEVARLVTDGTPNSCSFLYGRAAKAAFALGYGRIGTYILDTEPGTTLRAAGWKLIGAAGGGSWSRTERPRIDANSLQGKLLFEATQRGAELGAGVAVMTPAEAAAIAAEQIAYWQRNGWTAELAWQALTGTFERNHADWSAVRQWLSTWLLDSRAAQLELTLVA